MKSILYKAPDISVHNGNVNIKSVRDAGYPKVFLRAGYGKNNVDQKFVPNAEACVNLNVPVGLYWFSYALDKDMAAKEAGYAIACAKKYWKTCPIAFDLEYDTINYARKKGVNIGKNEATAFAIAFLSMVKAYGFTPVLYTNRDYLKNYFDIDKIRREVGCTVPVWFAYYSSNEPNEVTLNKVDMWQYTSKGRINGISGNVDINNVYHDVFNGESITIPKTTTAKTNLNILNFQKATIADKYTDNDGKLLVADGKDGAKTQTVRSKINLKAKLTALGWKVGSTGEVVAWWQTRLNEVLGLRMKVDGKFGKETRDATIAFQKKYNLKQDGVAGYNTIQTAFYN